MPCSGTCVSTRGNSAQSICARGEWTPTGGRCANRLLQTRRQFKGILLNQPNRLIFGSSSLLSGCRSITWLP